MKPSRHKKGPLPVLALCLLVAFVALLVLSYFGMFSNDRDFAEPVTYQAVIHDGEPGDASAQAKGLTIDDSGYGTVIEAPVKLVPAESPPIKRPAGISPELTGLVRALITVDSSGGPEPGPNGEMLCTLEGPPVWRGTVVMQEGCLVMKADKQAPMLLAAPGLAVFQDEDGFLALSTPPHTAVQTIRLGEPQGVFTGKACGAPSSVPAPAAIAAACGVSTVANVAHVARKPVCSIEQRRRLSESRRSFEESSERAKANYARCIARGNAAQGCPPPVIPPNYELFEPPCRLDEPS